MDKNAFCASDHTWVVCAYRESPYLEECIRSLQAQTVKSNIVIATSTPCEYITSMAEKYGIEVYVNRGKSGISGDWNYALGIGETELVTIAHQDDVYAPEYTEEMLSYLNQRKEPILYFTNYGELRNGEKVDSNKLLKIKRMLLIPTRLFPGWRFARRMSLAFGNAICCPSVTYRKSVIGSNPFRDTYKSNLDWELSEELSRRKGSFVYNKKVQMYHRIHEGSTTTEIIGDSLRTKEDFEMMKKFWPEGIARRLSKVYAKSEESNEIK